MNQHDDRDGVSRRDFIKRASLGATAAGVASLALAQAMPVEAATDGKPKRRSAGYHETEHVRRAYELARF